MPLSRALEHNDDSGEIQIQYVALDSAHIRTSIDLNSGNALEKDPPDDGPYGEDGHSDGYYEPARRVEQQPAGEQPMDYYGDLPPTLRAGYGASGPSNATMTLAINEQVHLMRERQDRIDWWIDNLDSQISLARTQGTTLENVSLEKDVPSLAKENDKARIWSGQEQMAIPVGSVHGSILMTSSGVSRDHTRETSNPKIRPSDTEIGVQNVVEEGPWSGREILLMIVLCLIQMLHFYPYGQGLATAVSVSTSILRGTQVITPEVTDADENKIMAGAAWITASYPLTHGAFSLIGLQLGTACGHKIMLMVATIFSAAFQLACAFASSIALLCVFRALAGLGAAFITANIVAIALNKTPMGRKRSMAIAMMGAAAFVGVSTACIVSAVFVQLTAWKWSFIAPACCAFATCVPILIVVPWDRPLREHARVDLVGSYLGSAGLCLFSFVFNQARAVGWHKVYIYALLPVALGHSMSFVFWERTIASRPVIPVQLWTAKHLPRTFFMALCSSVSLGVFLWYFSLFGTQVRKYALIQNGANFQSIAALSIAVAFGAVWFLSWASAKYLLAWENLALISGIALLAVAPSHLTFWAMMFPAVTLTTPCAALIQTACRASGLESLDHQHQSVAVTLFYLALNYGLSIGIGFAGTVETYTRNNSQDVLLGYRCAFIFAAAPAGLALVGALMFLGSDKRVKLGGFEQMKETRQQKKASSRLMERVRIAPPLQPVERSFFVERRPPILPVPA